MTIYAVGKPFNQRDETGLGKDGEGKTDPDRTQSDPNRLEFIEWFSDRCCDPRDVILDELQDEFVKVHPRNVEPTEGSKTCLELKNAGLNKPTDGGKGAESGCEMQYKQYSSDLTQKCWYSGAKNEPNGQPNGNGKLLFENGTTFAGKFNNSLYEREGVLYLTHRLGGARVEGKWVDGELDGEVYLYDVDLSNDGELTVSDSPNQWIEGYWSRGVPHGFHRCFLKDTTYPDDTNTVKLKYFTVYVNGSSADQIRVEYKYANCYLFRKPTKITTRTDNGIFIYPDRKTVIAGTFEGEDGKLVIGRSGRINGSEENTTYHGLRYPTVEYDDIEAYVYKFESPNLKKISDNHTLSDPYESQLVYVGKSPGTGGGEGLFARRHIKQFEVVSFYNGIRINTSSFAYKNLCESDYRLRLNADIELDIPKDMISADNYCATLAHKTNHSFQGNCKWSVVEHPRFGLIRCLIAHQDIAVGDEILVNYQMNLGDAPSWYIHNWLLHKRNVNKASNDSIVRILNRYTEDSGKKVNMDVVTDFVENNVDGFQIPDPQGLDLDNIPCE